MTWEVIRDEVANKLNDMRLKVFSVFLPMLASDNKAEAITAALGRLKDGYRSYWDGDKKLGAAYAKVMQAPAELPVAWDIYFL